MAIANYDCRKTYFDGLGTKIDNDKLTVAEVSKLAGLDYEVKPQPIFLENGEMIPDKVANVRTDNGKVLGVVGKNYEIVQNIEGFEFIEDIIASGAKYECAGTWKDGRGAFMLAKTDPIKILGDDFAPYILFQNTFDGTGTIKVMFTPVRVFCSNCFVLAEKQAQVKVSIRHSKSVKDNLRIAKEVLLANSKYLEYIKAECEKLGTTKFTREDYFNLVEKLTEVKEDSTKILKARSEELREDLIKAYNDPDLEKFKDTAYRAVMAVSDVESHKLPLRDTNNEFIYMDRVVAGMTLLNNAIRLIRQMYPGKITIRG